MIMMLLGRIYNYYSGIFTFSPRCLGALLVTISTKTFTLANNSRRFVLKPAYALTGDFAEPDKLPVRYETVVKSE